MSNFAFEDISLPRSWLCCDLLVLFIKFPNKQELHRARFKVNPWNNLTVNVRTDGERAVEALLDTLRVYSMQGPYLMTVLETVKNDGCASIIPATFSTEFSVQFPIVNGGNMWLVWLVN